MSRVDPSQLIPLQYRKTHIRNFCILAHVDHGKTTLSDSLVSSNGLFSARLAGKLRFLDSTNEEQERGITMHSSAISLIFKPEDKRQNQTQKELNGNGSGKDGSKAPETVFTSTPSAPSVSPEEYLINLIDSPGHIDFSSDVSTATRLCDGALIVVDVVEGVCTQTHAVLHKALKERMQPCLVLNKLDRMILEMKFTPVEAFHHLKRIVENVNALAYSLVISELRIEKEGDVNTKGNSGEVDLDHPLLQKWTFAPEEGNVVFSSALDCWGFNLNKFANMWAKKLEINRNVLLKYLWEDCAINNRDKKIVKCDPHDINSKPMFATMILEPIWQLYEIGIEQKDPTKASKMAQRGLNIPMQPRDINNREPRMTVSTIMNRWLPLPEAILRMVVKCMPEPSTAQEYRMPVLFDKEKQNEVKGKEKDEITVQGGDTDIYDVFSRCDNDPASQLVIFVSKMIPVKFSELSEQDKEILRRQRAEKMAVEENGVDGAAKDTVTELELTNDSEVLMALGRVFSGVLSRNSSIYVLERSLSSTSGMSSNSDGKQDVSDSSDSPQLIPADSIGMYLCLGPSIYPVEAVPAGNIVGIIGLNDYILKSATLSSSLNCPPLRPITFQATPMLRVALEPSRHQDIRKLENGLKLLYKYDPVVQVGVDDSNGQYTMTCLGELHMELCLKTLIEKFAQCEVKASEPLLSFRETIVFNEDKEKDKSTSGEELTLLPPPWGDLNGIRRAYNGKSVLETVNADIAIEFMSLPLPKSLLQIVSTSQEELQQLMQILTSLPSSVSGTEQYQRKIQEIQKNTSVYRFCIKSLEALIKKTSDAVEGEIEDEHERSEFLRVVCGIESVDIENTSIDSLFMDVFHRLVTLGPTGVDSNFLFLSPNVDAKIWPRNSIPRQLNGKIGIDRSNESEDHYDDGDDNSYYSPAIVQECASVSMKENIDLFNKIWNRFCNSVMTAFQLATTAGPLMHEPLHGVVFVISHIDITKKMASLTQMSSEELNSLHDHSTYIAHNNDMVVDNSITTAGQLISEVISTLHLSMLSNSLRIVEPMYSCNIQCDQSQIGPLYAVLSKRRGVVQEEDIIDGTSLFLIEAHMPVTDSFGFGQELLKKTSGIATAPQLSFSHWQTRDLDPFWKPSTEEELEDHGVLAAEPNGSRACVDKVRKRKGLTIEEKLVVHAEKQRTLNKKK